MSTCFLKRNSYLQVFPWPLEGAPPLDLNSVRGMKLFISSYETQTHLPVAYGNHVIYYKEELFIQGRMPSIWVLL